MLAVGAVVVAVLLCPPRGGGQPAPTSAWTVRLTADKPAYASGEAITLTLRLVNPSDRTLTLTFRSGQRFDFVVHDDQGRERWRWSVGQMFAQAMSRETVPPSGDLRYSATIEHGLPAGRYTVTGLIAALEPPPPASLAVRVEGTATPGRP